MTTSRTVLPMGPLGGAYLRFRSPQPDTSLDHGHGASASRGMTVYFPAGDEKLSRFSWLVTYLDGLPARRRSPIQILSGPDVD